MATEIDLGKVKGDKGEQGDPGSQWYYGTAITGTESTGTVFPGSGIENATVNDKYLNTGTGSDSGNVYTCVLAGDADTAQWSYAGSIRGDQGPQGPQGTTGAVDENSPIEFTEASELINLNSGESISVLFGKVAKAVSGLLSGAASTLLSVLTENRVLISDDNGKVAPSSVTKSELEYLSGAESNIQGQLNALNQNMNSIRKPTSISMRIIMGNLHNGNAESFIPLFNAYNLVDNISVISAGYYNDWNNVDVLEKTSCSTSEYEKDGIVVSCEDTSAVGHEFYITLNISYKQKVNQYNTQQHPRTYLSKDFRPE